ncbi:diguanylate cyclase [Pontibacillus yanchengensis]|uniref:Diguanylate cyclase n=1 Tax=Pontibacillus yanchengensis TaxID=462910 RepID=A0ACC7VEY6_9BACI|nr:diguanylate cyclase [Pontibacillus yanchengensis]
MHDMLTKQKKVALWVIWVLLWPSIFVLIYQLQPPTFQGHEIDLLSFALLMGIVALFPIIVNGTPIFFIHGIGLTVFIYFGLFVEIMLTQMAYIILFAKLRLPKNDLYKIPLNFLMFMFVSIGAAGVYYLFGGRHGALEISSPMDIIPILAYSLAIILINQLLLNLIRTFIVGLPSKFFNRSLLWEGVSNLIILPVALVLYILYVEIGLGAIYYVGVPFVSLSIILMLFYRSRRINDYLQRTSDIGHELTEKLEVSEVLDRFVENISTLLDVNYAYIYDVDESKDWLTLIRFYDATEERDFPTDDLHKFEGISGKVWGNAQGIYYHSRKQWEEGNTKFMPEEVESVISIPILRHNQVVGVLTLTSKKKRAYEKYQYMIVDILTNYLAVAIENARNYEETKRQSEICPLTNLYNYRYFEKHLQAYFSQLQKNGVPERIALILLDLDHFKEINDQYGHESGNEALCELADRLRNIISDKGTVARYGGEEFVILLPNVNQEHALHIAEHVRRKIANTPFTLHEHILEEKNPVQVYITASIGIATYPDDCEDPMELVRHADRAMYMGAKRQGRNKVASYEKVVETAE